MLISSFTPLQQISTALALAGVTSILWLYNKFSPPAPYVHPSTFSRALTSASHRVNTVTNQAGEKISTAFDAFKRGYAMDPNANCLGYRPAPGTAYKWLSYEDVSLQPFSVSLVFEFYIWTFKHFQNVLQLYLTLEIEIEYMF